MGIKWYVSKVKINPKGRAVPVNVFKIKNLPGVVFYEISSTDRGDGWSIAHEASGMPLVKSLFKNKKIATAAAVLFLNSIDMTKGYKELLKEQDFKKALTKLEVAAKIKLKDESNK